MALTPAQNEALIREVDDAVRQDDLLSFWRRFGKLVIGVVVAGLAAFGAWLLWQNYQHKQAEQASDAFSRVLASANTGTVDAAELTKVKDSGSEGYRAAATLVEAAVALRKGDSKGAAALYGKVAADGSAPQSYRDMALVRQTAVEFETLKPDAVIARLKPLAVAGNAWFGSAGEMVAIAHLKAGRPAEAGNMLAALTRDAQVPQTIKLRAGQLAGTLGVDAMTPSPPAN